jgi:hypothetical protein
MRIRACHQVLFAGYTYRIRIYATFVAPIELYNIYKERTLFLTHYLVCGPKKCCPW